MRIVILGTGALGCVFSARLADLAEVWMLGTWSESLDAVRRRGVVIEEPGNEVRIVSVATSSSPATVPPADIALILVKSYQTERAAAWTAQLLGTDGVAITLQNGLNNQARIAALVGDDRVVQGVTYSGATLIGPGHARLIAALPTYLSSSESISDRVAAFAALLNDCGLETHAVRDIRGRLWAKAIANAAINPLSALWRVPNGEVCESAERRKVLECLVNEAVQVAAADGVALPFDDGVGYVQSVCRATATNRSSMLQDVEHGRPTEIDSINGVIVEVGLRLGVPVPFNHAVLTLVRGMGEQASSPY